MPVFGFSTGALFKDLLREGVSASRNLQLRAIELSALRMRELPALIEFVDNSDLTGFQYVSLHAPTDFVADQEPQVAETLYRLVQHRHWHVVVHPDCLRRTDVWSRFGEWLCIENMDKRKAIGRTVEELAVLFGRFPAATLCFDIAHAHQVDTSMTEAFRILRAYSGRIRQMHVSEVTSSSKHDRISDAVLESFLSVANRLPQNVPVILETPVRPEEARAELDKAEQLFALAQVQR